MHGYEATKFIPHFATYFGKNMKQVDSFSKITGCGCTTGIQFPEKIGILLVANNQFWVPISFHPNGLLGFFFREIY
jgi:hypothetical protein